MGSALDWAKSILPGHNKPQPQSKWQDDQKQLKAAVGDPTPPTTPVSSGNKNQSDQLKQIDN